VDEFQVRQQYAVILLVEERAVLNHVQRYAVRQLDLLERGLLGQDFVDVRGQERVCVQDQLADGPLDGRFELLFRRWG